MPITSRIVQFESQTSDFPRRDGIADKLPWQAPVAPGLEELNHGPVVSRDCHCDLTSMDGHFPACPHILGLVEVRIAASDGYCDRHRFASWIRNPNIRPAHAGVKPGPQLAAIRGGPDRPHGPSGSTDRVRFETKLKALVSLESWVSFLGL
jgi:hypothetical protein